MMDVLDSNDRPTRCTMEDPPELARLVEPKILVLNIFYRIEIN